MAKTTTEKAKEMLWCVNEALSFCDLVLSSNKATDEQKKKAKEDREKFYQRFLVLDEILSYRQKGDIGTTSWRHAVKRFRQDIDSSYVPYEGYQE